MNPTKVILIVDDEPEIRAVLAEFISRKGCKILEAGSGSQAVEVLRTNHVDVVLTDLRMPNGDGLMVVEAIRAMPDPRPPAVLLSAYADLPPEQVLRLAAVPVLSKPFQLAQVWRTINIWLKVDAF